MFLALPDRVIPRLITFFSFLIDYKCQHCGESFDCKANLRLHKRSFHKKPAIMKCNICDRPFASEDSLRVHIKNVHEKKHAYKCEYCDKSYMWPGLLNHHVREKHEKQVRHTCNFCGKGNHTYYYYYFCICNFLNKKIHNIFSIFQDFTMREICSATLVTFMKEKTKQISADFANDISKTN